MASPSLVVAVRELADRLRAILRALPRDEDPFEPKPGRKAAPSFLFEMVALVGLLQALKDRGWAVREALPRQRPLRFLRAPGRKDGTTYFEVQKGDTRLQVVHGSELRDAFNFTQAPDISLQRGTASTDPTYGDLIAMWDMKLKGRVVGPVDSRIEKTDLGTFVWMRRQLRLQPPGLADDVLDDFPAAFSVSGLIGNGNQPFVSAESLLEEGVSCVAPYETAASPAKPTRSEHLSSSHTSSPQPARRRSPRSPISKRVLNGS